MHKSLKLINKIYFMPKHPQMLRNGCLQARRQRFKMAVWRKTLTSTEEVHVQFVFLRYKVYLFKV